MPIRQRTEETKPNSSQNLVTPPEANTQGGVRVSGNTKIQYRGVEQSGSSSGS